MKFSGRLEHLAIEGGVWILVTNEGRRFQLNPPPDGVETGTRVEVDGEPESSGVSFQMAAPILRVRNWRRADGR